MIFEDNTVFLIIQNHFACTGTLIADDLILTDAHCLLPAKGVRTNPSEIDIYFGSPSESTELTTADRFAVTPEWEAEVSGGFKVHGDPNFSELDGLENKSIAETISYLPPGILDFLGLNIETNRKSFIEHFRNTRGDIALIHFSKPSQSSRKKLALASEMAGLPTGLVYIAGFGNTSDEFSDEDPVLHYGQASLVAQLGEIVFSEVSKNSSGNCAGDSGAPMMLEMNGKIYLYALVRAVKFGCQGIGEYTKISPYFGWIESAAQSMRNSISPSMARRTNPPPRKRGHLKKR